MSNIKTIIDDKFWNERIQIVQDKMLPFQWRVLNDQESEAPKSGAINNFKIAAGVVKGEFYGMVFQDTDLYKWIESVAYSLEIKPNKNLQEWSESAIDLIAKAQMEDGYIDTYFQVKVPQYKWADLRDNHELYSSGHLIEAGVAYYQATGNQKIYDIITKLGDCLVNRFGPGKHSGVPGHPEIELALIRLYKLTSNDSYLNLAKYFIDNRGKTPNYLIEEAKERISNNIPSWLDINYNNGFVEPDDEDDISYYVASRPLVEQSIVEGHAVRAGYLYTALADLASIEKENSYRKASERLWNDATTKQMYIHGGLGSTNMNEGFTFDYDLPNESNYSETCAAIALIFWSKRMQKINDNSKYADVMERSLYNNCLGGMSLEGENFYYRNELERWGKNLAHAARPKWHACACCPPNLSRLILSLNTYIYHENTDTKTLYVDQYIGNRSSFEVNGETLKFHMESMLPWDSQVKFIIDSGFSVLNSIGFRIPEWSVEYTISLNDKKLYVGTDYNVNQGYVILDRKWSKGDTVTIDFNMDAHLVYANSQVKYDAGKAVIMKGPLIYCFEEQDNPSHLWQLAIDCNSSINGFFDSKLLHGVEVLTVIGQKENTESDKLYSFTKPLVTQVELRAIPYYARYNRKIGEMQVWQRVVK